MIHSNIRKYKVGRMIVSNYYDLLSDKKIDNIFDETN